MKSICQVRIVYLTDPALKSVVNLEIYIAGALDWMSTIFYMQTNNRFTNVQYGYRQNSLHNTVNELS